jgi:hypothetical protein
MQHFSAMFVGQVANLRPIGNRPAANIDAF